MLLFRPRDFLFALMPFIIGNSSLSAFDIPVELPSGQTIHLNMEYVGIDPDLYSVYIESTIKDPEEMRLFSDNPDITEIMSQSLKEKWEFHNFEFELRKPYEFKSLTFTPTNFTWESILKKPIFPSLSDSRPINSSGTIVLNGSIAGCGTICTQSSNSTFRGGVTISAGQLILSDSFFGGAVFYHGASADTLILANSNTLPTFKIEAPPGVEIFLDYDQIRQIIDGTITSVEVNGQSVKITPVTAVEKTDQKNVSSEMNLSNSPKPSEVRDDVTSLTGSSESGNGINNSQDKIKEDTTFNLRFSTLGSDFGGGWRLAPYELRFIQKQASFWDKGYPSDGIETMAVLVAPDECGLYQKQYAYSDFFPAKNTLNVLTAHPDSTFMLRSPSRGTFFFNSDGQLIRSLREEGSYLTYDYSDEKLTRIRHADCLDLFFEYEGEKVISIHGLPSRIHLEYDDQDLLCKIFDEQGSSLQISYDEDKDLDKIVDDTGAILFGSPKSQRTSKEKEEIDAIPLLFNGFGEVFYYQDTKNNLKISYRSWDFEDDDQDEQI